MFNRIMVRTYKKKENGPKLTEVDMANAIADCKNNKLSIYMAAERNGVPNTTLRRHLKYEDQKVAPPTVLTPAEEDEIVMTYILFGEWGFGIGKAEVVNVVTEFCKNSKRPNPFKNGVPGPDWWAGFVHHHPQLVKLKPHPLQMVCAKAATIELIDDWFGSCLQQHSI